MSLQRLGFGTYRTTVKNAEHETALKEALNTGVRLIDTSSNYMNGEAEMLIGKVMADYASLRPEVTIVDKFGYIQGENLKRHQEGLQFDETVLYQEGCYHCIHPDFMRDQLERSLNRLDGAGIDIYLLHNPEYYLQHTVTAPEEVAEARVEMLRRIQAVFTALEKAVAAGRIGGYGISSNSFSKSPDDLHFLPYKTLIDLANAAAKEAGSRSHHFKAVQLPINLLETGGLACAAWAHERGLKVLVNRPLNAYDTEGMHRLASYPPSQTHELNEQNLLAAADNYSLSDLRTLVTDMEGYKGRFSWPAAAEETVVRRIVPFVQSLLRRCDYPVREILVPLVNTYLQSYLEAVKHQVSGTTQAHLVSRGYMATHPLQNYALNWLFSHESIDTVLLGMRRRDYVRQAAAVAEESFKE